MKKTALFLVGTLFVLGVSGIARAEEPVAGGLVSNINIYDAQVIDQNGRDIKIIFDIINEGGTVNGDTVVPQVKYAVNLLKGQKDEEGSITFSASVDTFAYDEVLSVNVGEKIHKEIIYTVPDSIDGEFYINLDSKNEQGLPLTTVIIANPIKMVRAEEALEIVADSCVMKVGGEESSYSVYKGVDVDSNEQLSLECDVQNYSTQVVTFIPQITIFDRSVFGKQLSQNKLNQEVLAPQERKKIQFAISLPEAPQSYDAQLVLNTGDKLSNRVGGHFVVRGNSATIQDVQLDRDYYARGETAEMNIALDGRVDMFLGSRAFGEKFPEETANQDDSSLYIDIYVNGDDGECAVLERQKYTDSEFGYMKQTVTMQKDCKNPQIKIIAKDAKGNILRESTFNIATKENKIVAAEQISFSWIAIGVVAILSLIMLIIIAIKYRSVPKLVLFALVLSGGLLWSSGVSVEAATYNVPTSTTVAEQQAGIQRYTTLTINNNKASYPTTDTQMTMTFQGTIRSCGNGTWGFTVFNGYVKGASGISASSALYYVGGADALFNQLAKAMPVVAKTITIPDRTVGTHRIAMTGINWGYIATNGRFSDRYCDNYTGVGASLLYYSQLCEYDVNTDGTYWAKMATTECARGTAFAPCVDLNYGWADPLQFSHPYTVVAVVNGDCASTHNNCIAGSVGNIAIYPDSYQWWCNGLNGGSNELCTEWKINGDCATTHYNCVAGILGTTVQYIDSYRWWCNSPNGGSNEFCTEWKINGDCAATHYNCAAGILGSTTEYPNSYQWWCNSSNGGSNELCTELKPTCTQECIDIPTECEYPTNCGSGIQTCTWQNVDCSLTLNFPLSCDMIDCSVAPDLHWREMSPN